MLNFILGYFIFCWCIYLWFWNEETILLIWCLKVKMGNKKYRVGNILRKKRGRGTRGWCAHVGNMQEFTCNILSWHATWQHVVPWLHSCVSLCLSLTRHSSLHNHLLLWWIPLLKISVLVITLLTVDWLFIILPILHWRFVKEKGHVCKKKTGQEHNSNR